LKNVGKPAKEEGIESYLCVSLMEFEEIISSSKIPEGFTIVASTRTKLRGLLLRGISILYLVAAG
jgi:predicted peroxiredoxin